MAITHHRDATILLLHKAAATHAIALDSGLTAVPFGALLLLSRWKGQTLHTLLKGLIRQRLASVELTGPSKSTWRYALTHEGHQRALALIRADRELPEPPVYDAEDQLRVLPARGYKRAFRASGRRHCMPVGP